MSELPMLSQYEHADLEQLAGHPLSNEEAQMLRREITLADAFWKWFWSKEEQQRKAS